ncbi:unnamed protein product (macronuclear) [Paramecium tetraurelia]|uniref:Jacalin-type lectin domain-containing protein n=1 Tax=Paramecium tetraurelia TaxID=5888 RepID=A0D6U2_PARTE|nr:uncharacterized protein GSPATT00001800001 [Paramecium tetraurelia]CAK78759.1 unnamed protein product [Paramecium tetraurelia]|eukprot:XP_001446156.1 hypothetical protein (macronuclear) [Paramecium tetraurelia strain d4-2]
MLNQKIKKKVEKQEKIHSRTDKPMRVLDMVQEYQEKRGEKEKYLVSGNIKNKYKVIMMKKIQLENERQKLQMTQTQQLQKQSLTKTQQMPLQKSKINKHLNIIQYKIYKIKYKVKQIKVIKIKTSKIKHKPSNQIKIPKEIVDYFRMKMEMQVRVQKHNQKINKVNATVFKQKIGLQAEFQGKVNDTGATGYLQACISLNGDCVVVLHKRDFQYQGKPLQPVKLQGTKAQRIFGTVILIMGYPLTIGADYNLSWGFTESLIKTESELGISENLYASLGVTAYGELNIIYVIKIRAGVEGHVFKGSATGVAQFKFNQTDNSIVPNRYMVYLDFQIEALTFDLYASWQHISLNWVRRCIGRRWWKICWYFPSISYSNWSDVFRKSFQLAKLQATQRIFQLASKCF